LFIEARPAQAVAVLYYTNKKMNALWKAVLLLTLCLKPKSAFQVAPGSQHCRIPSSISRHMVLETHPQPSSPSSTTSIAASISKYPILRGSETDSRKIVQAGTRQHLQAIRVQHILFASAPLAQASLHDLRNAHMDFGELAQLLSACALTRDQKGQVGWLNVNMNVVASDDDDQQGEGDPARIKVVDCDNEDKQHAATASLVKNKDNELFHNDSHLNEIIPAAARRQLLQMTTKPGDIVMLESTRGYHLVQIVDVMADVRKMSYVKSRRRPPQQPRLAQFLQDRLEQKKKKSSGKSMSPKNIRQVDPENASSRIDLTYQLSSMGCQMNLADSERIEGQLQSLGIRPLTEADDSSSQQQPDIVILNTCSIRDHAEQKVYSYLGPHTKRKRQGEDVTIIVAGCVAQQEGEMLLRRCPEVDLVMGPQYANRIADLLEDCSHGNQVVATEATHIMEDSTKPRRQSTVAAWVNVIYGCNERCAFCVVPATRGVEQSRPVESIVREVEDLVQQGYKEVTLLGQNIDAYGRDMSPKRKFSDLIRTIGSLPGLDRLRFVTSHPRYMSMGVVDAVAETSTACECFHIPFQSGSNEVLAAMGRGHSREKYLHIIDRIRSRIPDAAITADVIVGFPGETEEQFQDTLRLMNEVVFDSINTAAYSPRPNTPAAIWENQIDEDIKQDRLQRINELNLKHAAERRARMVGRVVDVLIEERNVKVPTQVMGRTRHGYIVYCEGEIDDLQGKTVDVEITESATYHLLGRRI
jgi:tRNA-2-methylthio-N6-dimethylallyladenosine synthase